MEKNHNSEPRLPSVAQLTELIEAAADAGAYIERVEASEENTRVGGRLHDALWSIAGSDRQKYLDGIAEEHGDGGS